MNKLPVYILAGGKSSRFGSDKARAKINDKTLLELNCEVVKPVASSITVISQQKDAYQDLGLKTIADDIKDLGPMGGLQKALSDMIHEGWFFLISCDWVGLETQWFVRLQANISNSVNVVLYRDEFRQPLLTLYHTNINQRVDQLLLDGNRSLQQLLDQEKILSLDVPERWEQAHQINSQEEYIKYCQ